MASATRRGVSSLLSFIPAYIRPQSTDITSAALWGSTFFVGALWMVQPFDWIKQQLSKSEEEVPNSS